jgi:4,5-DOPA dioxygenase extradiol
MVAVEAEDPYVRSLRDLGGRLPRPRAVVVVSAHWQADVPVRVTASPRPETLHDFGGFPDELYAILYPAPGDPALAADLARRLNDTGLPAETDPRRGLDHGAWVPLKWIYPRADVPVVQVSLPLLPPERLVRLGRALAPLRKEGVLLVGSGGVVHNLGRLHWEDKHAPADGWAESFDRWTADRVDALDAPALIDYRARAPHAALAAPTTDHFDPLFAVLGAAVPGDRASTVFEGFHYGNLSLRTFLLKS